MAALKPPLLVVETEVTAESDVSNSGDRSRSRSRSPLDEDKKKTDEANSTQLCNKMASCTKTRIPSGSDEKLHVKKASGHHFLVPSPVPCRRTRTISTSKLAANSPVQRGTITEFCRGRGHGFVKPDDGDGKIFLHISDIQDEYVVQAGDRIEFRTIPMPPKMEQKMAVEAHLIDFDHSAHHERWDSKPDLLVDE